MYTASLTFLFKKGASEGLAGVAQWIEHQPVNQKVTGLIPGQGTCLGCGPGSQLGASERQPINVSLPLFLCKNKSFFFKKRSQ